MANELLVKQETDPTPAATAHGHIEARVKADVQARTLVAMHKPRDLDIVRQAMLKEAKRPGFAATAEFAIPRGGQTIRGPTIRFAEALARAMGNITVEVTVVKEDQESRICEASVTDLESNVCYRHSFVVRKVIERHKLPPGARNEDILGLRTNAQGETLYVLKASDQEVAMQTSAIASRVLRGLILRIAPADIVEEALQVARETRERADAADPDAAKKRLADAFQRVGVSVAQLKEYLGHGLDTCTPTEIEQLRGLYAALMDGHLTWQDVMRERTPQEDTSAIAQKVISTLKKGG